MIESETEVVMLPKAIIPGPTLEDLDYVQI